MKIVMYSFIALLTSTVTSPFFMAQEAPVKMEKIYGEKTLVKESASGDIPSYCKNDILWPPEHDIMARKIDLNDDNVKYPIRSTMDWIKRILRPEWIPGESQADIYALRAGKQGVDMIPYDALRMRYRAGDYVIQIASNSREISLVVGPYYSNNPSNRKLEIEDAKLLVNKMIFKFFNNADLILKTCNWSVKNRLSAVEGTPTKWAYDWWEDVRWWTDGDTVFFTMQKYDHERPTLPSLKADWFSPEKAGTKHRRLATKRN
jgi:hypothetical protein